MKWLIALLVVVAGGLAAASFAVPTNAATVNGYNITQGTLQSEIDAVAHDSLYACFLNGEAAVSTQGEAGLPTLNGAGVALQGAPNPTASAAYVASYLNTEIEHQIVLQLAAQRHLTVTAAELKTARTDFENEISSVMSELSGSSFACGSTTQATSGQQVLAALPASFVDPIVRFDATVTVLEDSLAGVGSSVADLEGYYHAHEAEFDTACFTVAEYSTSADAQAAIAKVKAGTPFATVAAQVPGGGPQGCDILYGIASELPTANLEQLADNALTAPVDENGQYLVIQITSRTVTPFETAKSTVQTAVQSAGTAKAHTLADAAELHAHVSVDPRYGTWKPSNALLLVPAVPAVGDLLNTKVDSIAAGTTAPKATTPTPAGGASG